MAFAKKVEGLPVKLLPVETVTRCIDGVEKRIRRERDRTKSKLADEDYLARRIANISRLKIIRDELKELEKQL